MVYQHHTARFNDFKKDFKKEIEVYGNNSGDYSYVYYIMKKEVRQ